MTYTAHRDTQQTLAILDTLDMDKLSDEELARKFGWEEDYHKNRMTQWQRVKPKLWLLFDEPYSSFAAKVCPPYLMVRMVSRFLNHFSS